MLTDNYIFTDVMGIEIPTKLKDIKNLQMPRWAYMKIDGSIDSMISRYEYTERQEKAKYNSGLTMKFIMFSHKGKCIHVEPIGMSFPSERTGKFYDRGRK